MANRLHSLILTISAGILLASSVPAVAQKAPPKPKTISDSINYIWHDVEHDFTALAEAMPEDKWNFKPTQGEFKNVRTFGEQLCRRPANKAAVSASVVSEVNLGVRMELWTGIACLVADPNCKDFRRFGDDGKGAYVNIVACASSGEEFRSRVEKIIPELDCILLELEHIQLLNERLEQPDCPEDLIEMRSTVERQPADIVFGTFHTWIQSDIT